MRTGTLIPSSDLHRDIASAATIVQLRAVGVRMPDLVGLAISSGADIKSVVQSISLFNDTVTLRLIALLENTEGIRLPEGATLLVLGSEGRGEQTLRTDQDNAIVYNDDLPANKLRAVERFATRFVEALEEIGVPRCPGNIMASNPQWCHSVGEWKKLLTQWIAAPTPTHILNFGMFQDLRALHGDTAPATLLHTFICSTVQCNAVFFPNMAEHVVRFQSPFNMFGRIRVEQSGESKGMVDLKKVGIFAITTGASLLSLEFGTIGGNTWEKLERLGKSCGFSSGDLEAVAHGFSYLVKLRLQQQLLEAHSGSKQTNCVDPKLMTDTERGLFRQALKGVTTFLWIFRNHYLLDYSSM
jgi:CBS domain-containing protein